MSTEAAVHLMLLYCPSLYLPPLPSPPSLQLDDLDSLIKRVDSCTGMAKCQHVLSQLEYIFDSQVRVVEAVWLGH